MSNNNSNNYLYTNQSCYKSYVSDFSINPMLENHFRTHLTSKVIQYFRKWGTMLEGFSIWADLWTHLIQRWLSHLITRLLRRNNSIQFSPWTSTKSSTDGKQSFTNTQTHPSQPPLSNIIIQPQICTPDPLTRTLNLAPSPKQMARAPPRKKKEWPPPCKMATNPIMYIRQRFPASTKKKVRRAKSGCSG